MDNVILIGMPGSGKSTVGLLLAKRLGYSFIDTDLLIQQSEGKRLFEILRDDGADYFMAAENRVNAAVTAQKTVIATGGSVVFGKDAMEHFKSIGRIVYLKVPFEELEKRVKNFETRGVLMREGQSFADIFRERTPLYEKYADVTVEFEGGDIADNAIKIENALN